MRSNGKRGIILADSLANQSDWICTKQTRIHGETNSGITASYVNWVVQLSEVCKDVQTEPTLLPINENNFDSNVNTAENARLDISVRWLWNSCEKTFLDIWITHPTSQSYSDKSLAQICQQHEKEKDKYNQRVIDIEKSSFNPIVFTISGGMAPECTRVKRLAEKIAEKRLEPYHMHLS